jgi:hypothetical protein
VLQRALDFDSPGGPKFSFAGPFSGYVNSQAEEQGVNCSLSLSLSSNLTSSHGEEMDGWIRNQSPFLSLDRA